MSIQRERALWEAVAPVRQLDGLGSYCAARNDGKLIVTTRASILTKSPTMDLSPWAVEVPAGREPDDYRGELNCVERPLPLDGYRVQVA